MRIQASSTSLMEPLFCMFWYAVYALALFILFATRIWSAIGIQVACPQKAQQTKTT
jgi:hypothetical protein